MLTKSYTYFIAALLSTVIFILAGCSGSSTSQNSKGAVSAKLVWNGSKTNAKSVASAPVGVTTVRLAISGAGITTIQQDFPAADGTGTLSGVPAATGLTVTASGLDASGAITHQGSVANVTVQVGQTTDVGTITLLSAGTIAGTYIGTFSGGSGSPVTITMIIDANGVITGFDSQGASISGTANTQTGAFTTTTAATAQNGNTPVYCTGTINIISGAFTATFSVTPPSGITETGTFSGTRSTSQSPTYSNASLIGPWLLVLPDGTVHDYFTFNGNGLLSDSSTYNHLAGSYIVQASGNFTLNMPRTNAATESASGTLNSVTTGSFNLGAGSNGPAGVYSIVKVSNPAACQGAWNATLLETVGGATYDIAYAVDANGAISNFSGFTGPVTGHMYAEAGKLSSFFTTGRSDAYNQFAIWGSLSGNAGSGIFDNDSAPNDVGTVVFKRYFIPSAIIGKTIYWADQGGYGYFRFTADGKFYGTGNINNGESAEAGPGTYTVQDRGVVSYQIPPSSLNSTTFLSNNFAGEYWRVQLSSGTYERWFYGANAAADAQAFYLSGVAP